jgi:hypothetical protein
MRKEKDRNDRSMIGNVTGTMHGIWARSFVKLLDYLAQFRFGSRKCE